MILSPPSVSSLLRWYSGPRTLIGIPRDVFVILQGKTVLWNVCSIVGNKRCKIRTEKLFLFSVLCYLVTNFSKQPTTFLTFLFFRHSKQTPTLFVVLAALTSLSAFCALAFLTPSLTVWAILIAVLVLQYLFLLPCTYFYCFQSFIKYKYFVQWHCYL